MTRLSNLKDIKPLTRQTGVGAITALQFVKSYADSVAYTDGTSRNNREGGIIALSMVGDSSLTTLELGEEAQKLQYLSLSGNKSLKKVVFETSLPCLTHLYLDNCGLTEITIPAGCEALKQIYLQGNALTEVVFEGDCPALELLDVSENKLTGFRLPRGFKQLKYLYLTNNKIKTLYFASNLRRLTILHLNSNGLIELPANFLKLTGLETLYLSNSPLRNLPTNMIADKENKSSLQAVRTYLSEYSKGTTTNDRAKLIIVGNGRVGKTSMYRRLKNEDFDQNEKYTHGIHIGDLEKAHIPEVNTSNLQLKVWDFGGQEIFYATHQFFLSEEAIYILAWTNEKNVLQHRERDKKTLPFDEKWRDYGYWLDNIRLHGKDSPILMVQTNSDCRQNRLTPEADCTDVYKADLLDFSALKKSGLEELKGFIADKLNGVIPMFGKEFPETYDAVIDAVEDLKVTSISLKAFYGICKEAKISKGNELAVLDYLKKSGLVVYFDKPLLKERVFTDPNWLTKQVYRLINNDLREKKGKINAAYLETILKDYTPPQRSQFVELLKNFELIFETGDDTKKLYIAPQYLPDFLEDEALAAYEMIFEDLSLAFVFRFPKFMPDNIMINFLSRYGPFSKRLYWKNGICFTNDRKVKCSVVYDAKDQSLSVYTSESAEKFTLQHEICQAFVELSKKTNAEISVDGHAFASWQDLTQQAELYEKDLNHRFFAVDKTTHLCMQDFVVFLGKGDMHRHFGKNIEEPIKNKELMDIQSQVRQLIGKARTDDAIKLIEDWASQTANQRAQSDIAMIAAAWITLRREINIGVAENENKRRAVINKQVLDFDYSSKDVPTPIPPPKPSTEAIKLLFLGANPFETGKLNLKEEYAQIAKRLENEKAQSKLMLQSEFSTTLEDFQEKTNRFRPNIVHFVGHGKDENNELTDFAKSVGIEDWKNDCGLIFFDSDHRAPEYINALALDYNFETFLDIDKIPINIVIFNACYSIHQAEVIAKRVKYVVGVNNKIADGASIDFTAGFYFRLMEDCENVIAAFRYGKGRAINKLKDRNHIVLFVDGEKTNF